MIILITGQPGSGKTALCVDMLAHDEQFKDRPKFVGGIPDLELDHSPVPPVAEWTEFRKAPEDDSINLAYFTFPAQSVIVVDEAQRIYRPRSVGTKVPPEVAAFETHRHTGVDFILLTQHPGLLDSNIRKLVGKHIHIAVTPFGRYRYEWTKAVDPENKAERDIAARSKYVLPKRAFKLYKSSELHTKIKSKIPGYVWLFIAAIVGVAVMTWYVYGRISTSLSGQPETVAKIGGEGRAVHTSAPAADPADLVKSLVPRLPGLYHTAPRYDDITKPTDAPWPSLCVMNHKTDICKCIDQQGNAYKTPHGTCLSIVENGIFKDWASPTDKDRQRDKPDAPQARQGWRGGGSPPAGNPDGLANST